ncbi:MAG: hypothetical protein IT320_21770 [Anaerolineae bacterium]|nr:hypothetical protein [Anaerolineae bacterium]
MLDRYAREHLVRERITDFQREAAHRRLVNEARGESQRLRPPTWLSLFVVSGMIAWLIGAAV